MGGNASEGRTSTKMNSPTIQFLFFDGCPLAPRARTNLEQAVNSLPSDKSLSFEEVDLMSRHTPNELKRWGSPTILVNGCDITGAAPGDSCSCRIYASEGGVPTAQEIASVIGSKLNSSMSACGGGLN